MTPQELKNSILQMAIQGKLVEQRPEEGTGEGLYRQIQEEKQRLIEAGKIKKEKPLPEIAEDEKPFEIPESWMWVRFSEIIDVRDGTHDTPKYVLKGIPLVTSKNLVSGSIDFKTTRPISYEDAEIINSRSAVDDGDILFAMIGTIGSPVLVKKNREFCIKNIALFKVISQNLFDMEYLLLFLQNEQYIMKKKASGGVQSFVSLKFLRQYLLPLPPLAEQKRIVAKIKELLPYIDRYEKTWTRLEELNKRFPDDMKKSILQMAIQGKLVGQRPEEGTAEELYQQIQEEKRQLIKDGKIKKEKPLPEITENEKPFVIPENWKWVRWGNLSESIQYGYNAPAQPFGQIKMVRISDIQDGEVQWDTVPYCDINDADISAYLLQKNDILFARTGGTVGKSYLVKDVPEETIYAGYLIRTRYSSWLYPEYMKYFMESQLYWTQLRDGTIATAQPNCNGKTLSKMILPLPPLVEQKRIVAKLEELLPLCEMLK